MACRLKMRCMGWGVRGFVFLAKWQGRYPGQFIWVLSSFWDRYYFNRKENQIQAGSGTEPWRVMINTSEYLSLGLSPNLVNHSMPQSWGKFVSVMKWVSLFMRAIWEVQRPCTIALRPYSSIIKGLCEEKQVHHCTVGFWTAGASHGFLDTLGTGAMRVLAWRDSSWAHQRLQFH